MFDFYRERLERKPGEELISAREAADILGVTLTTLARMRANRSGPEHRKNGRLFYYSRKSVLRWKAYLDKVR